MKHLRHLLAALLAATATYTVHAATDYRPTIDLSGTWMFCTEPDTAAADLSDLTFTETVVLPGTTATNHKGTLCKDSGETTHLHELYPFEGTAYYRKDIVIPKDWNEKTVSLLLERTKATTVYVDGKFAGTRSNISTPQTYDLTRMLTPGRHVITIAVDNSRDGRIPEQLFTASHALTSDTQTNWNGIVGKIRLQAQPKVYFDSLKVTGGIDKPVYSFLVRGKGKMKGRITVTLTNMRNGRPVFSVRQEATLKARTKPYGYFIAPLLQPLERWSDENPALYRLTVVMDGADSLSTIFADRNFRTDGHRFTINGKPTFLRGKHDACVFPLTAYAPMDRDSWLHYFHTLKEYGINHVRFHSWCPPEACFEAADETGFYLQPELPFWGDFNSSDSKLMDYLHNEGSQILKAYGHHPSFVMMALGNELWGDIDKMRAFTNDFRNADSTKVYTFGSNFYLGYKGVQPGIDYLTTCRIGGEAWGQYNTHTRGSFSFADAADGGLINHQYPNSVTTFDDAIGTTPVPVISHETGQFQMYPDFREITKYTGVLSPDNMKTFSQRLQKAGMEDRAQDFFRASGEWAVELYKADIEMDLRTRNMAGFQLLDLQDYPGQGSAYIGILDAFMDNKGLVTPQRWREWCSEVVPLFETQRFCYTDGETISGRMKIASYTTKDYPRNSITWTLTDDNGKVKATGNEPILAEASSGLISVADLNIQARLTDPNKSEQLTLTIAIDGTAYRNSWRLWIYPDEDYRSRLKSLSRGIIVSDSLTTDILAQLEKGGRVLLMPKQGMYKQQTVGGLFQTDYWNYRMFRTICENNKRPVSPGTLGLLINDSHALFRGFPTSSHTDWQWRDMAHGAQPLIVDDLPGNFMPIVQVIDNVERNHRLAMVLEARVGKGKLLVCMADMNRLAQHPESKRFHLALLEYMQSDDFVPSSAMTTAQLSALFCKAKEENNMEKLNNISFGE